MDLKEVIKDAVVISENDSFNHALQIMLNNHTNTLLVVDDEGILSGEVCVSNLFEAIIPTNADGDTAMNQFKDEAALTKAVTQASDIPVFEFMSPSITSITPDDSLLSVAATAVAEGSTRIAVVDHNNHPIGIISRQGLKQILGKLSQK